MPEFIPKLTTRTSLDEPIQSGLAFEVNTIDRKEGRPNFVASMGLASSWPLSPRVDTFCSENEIPTLRPGNNDEFDRAQTHSNDCGEDTSYTVNTRQSVWSTNVNAGLIWGPYDDRFYFPITVELHNLNVTRKQDTEIDDPDNDWPESFSTDRLTTHHFDAQLRSGFLYSPEDTALVLGAEMLFLKYSLDNKEFDPNEITWFEGIQLSVGLKL